MKDSSAGPNLKETRMFAFNKKYFFAAAALFLIEVCIALFVRDNFVRPYGGDFLVVLFLYCLLKSFLKIPVVTAIFIVLSFAYLVEWMQYLDLVVILDLQNNPFAQTILGTSFEWLDMLVYTLGALCLYLFEKYVRVG